MVMAPPTAPPKAPEIDPVDAFAQRLLQSLAAAGSKQWQPGYGDAVGYKHDSPGSPITAGYSHGDGGNLSFPGVDPMVFHTHVGHRGIIGQLPVQGSVFTNPTYQVYTGVTATTGAEKDGVCELAPVAGLLKSGLLTSVFGRYERATSEIELNRLGQRLDRSDPMDLSLVGSPIQQSGLFNTGPAGGGPPADLLSNEFSRKMWELATAFHRLLGQQIWTGSPANNSAGGGYKELTGLSLLVATGHTDAQTGLALPSVDSDVKDFNYLDVSANGAALVDAIAFLYHTRKTLAIQTGIMPVRFVLVMHPDLFHEVSAVWPCSYLTSGCALPAIGGGGAILNLQGDAQIALRDQIRTERFLPIEGDRIEVIVDDGIPTDTSTTDANVPEGAFSSDIFLLPMSVAGGNSVLFLEHFQYDNPAIQDALGNLTLGRIEGAWITVPTQTRWCLQWQTKIEPRLVLRTPWLAGRLDNVVASPLQRTRSPFPDDPYHVDGGETSRPGPSLFALWKS